MSGYQDYVKNNQTYGLNTQRAGGIETEGRAAVNNITAVNSAEANGMAVASTNIFIYANGSAVGMIQSFAVNENRNINKLQAIGYEGVVQAVPSNTQGGTIQVSRMALYESNLGAALGLTDSGKAGSPLGHKVHQFGRNSSPVDYVEPSKGQDSDTKVSNNVVFSTLRDQRIPFEILVKTPVDPTRGVLKYYEERYVDCWIQNYSKTYQVGTITVAESATISYGDVY